MRVCVCGFCDVWVCVCMGFCYVWVCVYVGFVMCARVCVGGWVLYCVGVCLCGFCNV